jgi:hypothetical protein
MILPTKHLSPDRALLSVGARLLALLRQPKTVSALWDDLARQAGPKDGRNSALSYDAFILALDLLFLMGVLDFQHGLLSWKAR